MTDSYPILSRLSRSPAGRLPLLLFHSDTTRILVLSQKPQQKNTGPETMFNSLKTIFYYAPSELSGDFIHALQRLGADRGLGLDEQPRRESAATVQPPPRHLPPPGVPLR